MSGESPAFHVVESGMYACVYLDNYDEEIYYARRLRDYCRENRYTIAGDYICEVMTGFHVFDNDPRTHVHAAPSAGDLSEIKFLEENAKNFTNPLDPRPA